MKQLTNWIKSLFKPAKPRGRYKRKPGKRNHYKDSCAAVLLALADGKTKHRDTIYDFIVEHQLLTNKPSEGAIWHVLSRMEAEKLITLVGTRLYVAWSVA